MNNKKIPIVIRLQYPQVSVPFLLKPAIYTIQYKIYALYCIIFEQKLFIPQLCTVFNPN